MFKVILRLINLFNDIPCDCGCKETKVAGEVLMDTYGPICEYEVRCVKCNRIVNYWAYGYYEFPATRMEQFARWQLDKRLYLKGFIQGFIQGFKDDLRRYRR